MSTFPSTLRRKHRRPKRTNPLFALWFRPHSNVPSTPSRVGTPRRDLAQLNTLAGADNKQGNFFQSQSTSQASGNKALIFT